MSKTLRLNLFLFVVITLISGCGGSPDPIDPTQDPDTVISTELPTPIPTDPEPTSTTPAPLVIVLASDQTDVALKTAVEAQVSELAAARGLRFQIRQEMSAGEVEAEADYVVALPPQTDFNSLVSGAPSVRFFAVAIPGVEPADNLVLIQTDANSAEVEAFMGGYIGALITGDWRIGIITVEDGGEQLRFDAFENGMRFFCGLCRPQYAPFYAYPFKLSLPAGASDVEWRALAEFMRDRLVSTVYVSPGAGGSDMLSTLASLNVNIIGSTPPLPGLESSWVASLRSEPTSAYAEYLPRFLDGEAGLTVTVPIEVTDINVQLFGAGKQRLADQTLADLLGGFILPGNVP